MTRKELYDLLRDSAGKFYEEREAASVAYYALDNIFGISKLDLAVSPEHHEEVSAVKTDNICRELSAGRPVQYICGNAFFYGRKFNVDNNVLIPRPETEELAKWIIDSHSEQGELHVLDIGTGSGAIAVTLGCELMHSFIDAVDISEGALGVASANALNNHARVNFIQADVLDNDFVHNDALRRSHYDIIVSNPPYIPNREKSLMRDNVLSYEPHGALFVPDNDPLIFYRAIAQKALVLLKEGGWLYFEIHEDMADDLLRMYVLECFDNLEVRQDLNGKNRMFRCRKK